MSNIIDTLKNLSATDAERTIRRILSDAVYDSMAKKAANKFAEDALLADMKADLKYFSGAARVERFDSGVLSPEDKLLRGIFGA